MIGVEIINAEALKLIDDFEQAALMFGEIQQEHVQFLRRDQLGDMQMWSDQRSQAMGKLQQALNAVWGCDALRADARLGQSLQNRIGKIVEQERELVENVRSCQDQLKSEMGTLRKGKKAMGGYGAATSVRKLGLCYRNSL